MLNRLKDFYNVTGHECVFIVGTYYKCESNSFETAIRSQISKLILG